MTSQASTSETAVPAPAVARQHALDESAQRPYLSVVIPLLDEAESLQELHEELVDALADVREPYELVLVDDGSTDDTFARLSEIARHDVRVRVVRLRRNFGQTAAMAAGFDHACGEIIVAMDGDLQNDPRDIPLLLAKLDEGFDVVSGWRRQRAERSIRRRLPSKVANWLIGKVTGVPLHDYGCSLKAYRSEIVRGTRLYGEMHRFIPALAHFMGARITEIPVRHHARKYGESKYGLKRTIKVLLDLLTVKFFASYSTKPIYVFGGTGAVLCLIGTFAAGFTLYEKYAAGIYVHRNPLFVIGVFLFSIGANFILMGLLAEIAVRTYHESQEKPTYWVRELRNFDSPDA